MMTRVRHSMLYLEQEVEWWVLVEFPLDGLCQGGDSVSDSEHPPRYAVLSEHLNHCISTLDFKLIDTTLWWAVLWVLRRLRTVSWWRGQHCERLGWTPSVGCLSDVCGPVRGPPGSPRQAPVQPHQQRRHWIPGWARKTHHSSHWWQPHSVKSLFSAFHSVLKVWVTVMDGVQALIFKAGRRPATSWANAARTVFTMVNWFSGKLVKLVPQIWCQIFKAQMHQIWYPLGLRPRPRWETYSAPQTP